MNVSKEVQQLMMDIASLNSALTFHAIVERAAAYGRKCVEEGYWVNSIIALCPKGVSFQHLVFETDQEKDEVFGRVANNLALHNAQLAVLISDVWLGRTRGVRPSADPSRRQALVVSAVVPEGKVVRSWLAFYDRVNGHIHWHKAETDGRNEQCVLRPWVITIRGITCPLVIPAKVDGDNMRMFLTLDEDGNATWPS